MYSTVCQMWVNNHSKLERLDSILDRRNSKTSRIEAWVESQDVRGRSKIYRDRSRILEVEFRDFRVEKQRTFRAINYWHVWILRKAYFIYILAFFIGRSILSSGTWSLAEFVYQKIRYGAFLSLTSFTEIFLGWVSQNNG